MMNINKDVLEGRWHEIRGAVKAKWGELTDDDLTTINGKREQLVGALQRRYGSVKEVAERDVESFLSSFKNKFS